MSKATRPTRGKSTTRSRGKKPAAGGAVVRPRSDAHADSVPIITPVAKGILVSVAIEKHRAGGTPGVKSTVYRLEDGVLLSMLCAYVDGRTSVEQVLAAHRPDLRAARVSDRSAAEWLTAVRKIYGRLHNDRLNAIKTDDGVQIAIADPDGARERLLATLCYRAQREYDRWDELSVSERHAALRLSEIISRLRETDADVGHRRAQTDKITAALRQAIDEQQERTDGKQASFAEVIARVEQISGIKVSGEQPATAKAAAKAVPA